MTIFNIFFCIIPLILVDIFGLIVLSWGSQLYITIIESLVLSLLMLIITLIEIKTSWSLAWDYYKIDGHDPILNDDSEDVDAA